MRRVLRPLLGLGAFVLAGVLIFWALFAVVDRIEERDENVIVVGSKAFSEAYVLAEMFAQLIEAHAGLEVERRLNLGGTHICFQALKNGEIDLYPEYTGTGLMAILDGPPATDPAQVLGHVREVFAARWDLTWLDPFAFDNSYTLAMHRPRAEALGITKISDLVGRTDLVGGFATEFLARGDGYPGLAKHYGLELADTRAMEAGLMYQAAESDSVDVVSAYATDARIDKMDLVVLEDDKEFFPPYNAAPLVRRELLAAHPEVRDALGLLAGRLDDAQMRALNGQVDVHGRDPHDVAREYLVEIGALGSK